MADSEERRVVTLEIVAKGLDEANARLKTLERSARESADALTGLQDRFESAKHALEGLAGAVGAFELAKLVQETANAQAELLHMAERSGTTAQALSALKESADLVHTPIEGVAKGLGFLASSLVQTVQGTGKASAAFAALHLDARQLLALPMEQSFTQVAKALAGVENPALRVAYAKQILGREGRMLIPLLLELAENGAKEAQVTDQQALAAAEYQRTLAELQQVKERMLNTIVSQAMPAFQAFAKTLLDNATSTGSLSEKTKELAAQNKIRDWAIMAGTAIASVIDLVRGFIASMKLAADGLHLVGNIAVAVFEVVGTSIGATLASLKDLAGLFAGIALIMSGKLLEGAELVKVSWGGLKAGMTGMFDDMRRSISFVAVDIENFSNSADKLKKDFKDNMFTEAFLKNVDEYLAKTYEIKNASTDVGDVITKHFKTPLDNLALSLIKTTAEMKKNISDLQQYGFVTKQTSVAETEATIAEMKRNGVMDELASKIGPKRLADALAFVRQLASEKDALQAVLSYEEYRVKALADERDEIWKGFDALVKREAELKKEIETYGLSKVAIIDYTIAQLEAKKAVLALNVENADAVRGLDAQINKLKELRGQTSTFEDIKNQVAMWSELADRGSKLFVDMVSNGKNAFQTLIAEAKRFALELLAIFAKRYILEMAANATTGQVSTALSTQAMQLGTNSFGGQLMGLGSSTLFGSSAVGAGTTEGVFAGGTLTGETSGLIGSGGLAATIGSGATSLATGMGVAAEGAAAFGEAVAAAVPVIGWVVAIGMILYSMFGNKGGGPKGGGSFMGTFDSGPNFQGGSGLIGNLSVPGTDNGRFFTPNDSDNSVKQIVTAIGTNFFSTLRALGGHADGVSFGLGFDTDPNGTAANRISSSAFVGGRQVFSSRDRDVGRDNDHLQEELKTEAARLLLAGLQASELPQEIATVINSISAQTASSDQITQILSYAGAIAQLNTVLSSDVVHDVNDALETNQAVLFHRQTTALHDLTTQYDGSVQGTNNLIQATAQYRASLMQLIADYEKVGKAIQGMFDDTVRGIQYSVLDNQGRYNFLQNESSSMLTQALSSTDPQAIQQFAQRINQDITDAFNLLSPEQQQAMAPEFIARANAANAAIQTHLHEVQQTFITEGQAQIAAIRTAIEEAAKQFAESATTNNQAANTNLHASENNLSASRNATHIIVDLRNGTATVVNDGG